MTARSAPIRVENALGVCSVRADTRLLAEVAGQGPTTGRALDLGTGSGYVAIYLARRGWNVDAVDISPRALDLARRNARLNGVAPQIFHSDLFSAVQDPYDVIACNPPMRGDETESSRLVTATLRRIGALANLLMRATRPVLERKRLGFLVQIATGARPHLTRGGRLILVISPREEAELPGAVPGLLRVASLPVTAIPGLNVVTFVFEKIADESR